MLVIFDKFGLKFLLYNIGIWMICCLKCDCFLLFEFLLSFKFFNNLVLFIFELLK